MDHVNRVESYPDMRRHPGNNQCDQVKRARRVHADKLARLSLDMWSEIGDLAGADRVGVGARQVDLQFLPEYQASQSPAIIARPPPAELIGQADVRPGIQMAHSEEDPRECRGKKLTIRELLIKD